FPKIENPDGVEWFPLGLPDGTAVAINIDDFKTYMGFAASANYKGNATPSTDPGTPPGPEFYTATEVGTYTNFGGIEVTSEDAFVLLSYDGADWSKAVANIDLSAYATKDEIEHLATKQSVEGAIIKTEKAFTLTGTGVDTYVTTQELSVSTYGA